MSATNGARQAAPGGYAADIAPVAALMADPARAAMLGALLGGTQLSAGELSQLAGVSPATASAHLARLLDGGLVAVTRQGKRQPPWPRPGPATTTWPGRPGSSCSTPCSGPGS